jgi:AcrR family transcriptional regulator
MKPPAKANPQAKRAAKRAVPLDAAAPRWRRRAAARPAEIIDAALTVFSARGFEAATLDEVAREAGISKGTLYLYFDSKTALFEAMALELMQGVVMHRLDALLEGEAPAAALHKLVGFMTHVLDDPRRVAMPKLIIAESARFPQLAEIWLKTVITPLRGRIIALIERGIATGAFRKVDAFETSKLVIAPLLVAALWRQTFERFDDRPSNPALMLREHGEILLRGLAKTATKE